jgi:hypothetical protein
MKITDEQIIKMADSLDSYLLEFAKTNDLPAFLLVSVVLARLSALCLTIDMSQEFKRLLTHSIESMDEFDNAKPSNIH